VHHIVIPLFEGPFWFLRHGETVSNAARIIAGSTDTPLTDLGRRQAEAAAQVIADLPITAIYVSPLSRARETAAPIARKLDLPLVTIPGLAERRWGDWEGQPHGVLDRAATPPGAGESPDVFSLRVLAALASITGGGLPLIVAHSGIGRVLRQQLLGGDSIASLPNAQPLLFTPTETGWSLLQSG
jgi:probable phosphoglycerate mutase